MLRVLGDVPVSPLDRLTYDPAMLWTIIGIVAGVTALTVVLVIVLVKHKKKKRK